MRFLDTMGRAVVDVTHARTLGTVSGFVVDPGHARVAGLRLRKPGGGRSVLAWRDVWAIGPDAVMARAGADDGLPPDADLGGPADQSQEMPGKRILTELGAELGSVEDVDFDPETGALRTVIAPHAEIDARRVRGLGSYALVVRAE